MTTFTKSVIGQAAFAWLDSLGRPVRPGLSTALDAPGAERIEARLS